MLPAGCLLFRLPHRLSPRPARFCRRGVTIVCKRAEGRGDSEVDFSDALAAGRDRPAVRSLAIAVASLVAGAASLGIAVASLVTGVASLGIAVASLVTGVASLGTAVASLVTGVASLGIAVASLVTGVASRVCPKRLTDRLFFGQQLADATIFRAAISTRRRMAASYSVTASQSKPKTWRTMPLHRRSSDGPKATLLGRKLSPGRLVVALTARAFKPWQPAGHANIVSDVPERVPDSLTLAHAELFGDLAVGDGAHLGRALLEVLKHLLRLHGHRHGSPPPWIGKATTAVAS
jgi:hypothetical protein